MPSDTYVTLSGNLTSAPKGGISKTGAPWARLRLACAPRVFDRADNQWRDGETMFIDVMCWRQLAENVLATLERGDGVIAVGRLRVRTYEDEQGGKHTVPQLEADAAAADLSWVTARLLRKKRTSVSDRSDAVIHEDAAGHEAEDGQDFNSTPADQTGRELAASTPIG